MESIDWEKMQVKFDEFSFSQGDHMFWKTKARNFQFMGKQYSIARAAYQLYNREKICDDENVINICNEKYCISQDHLKKKSISTRKKEPSADDWENLERRLMKKVDIDEDKHWNWTGSISIHGYGNQLSFFGNSYQPHVLSWMTHNQKFVEKGVCVRHKCKIQICISPNHLEIGTPQQNANDRVRDDTVLKGERNHNSILTEEDVLKIFNSNDPQTKLARDFGVCIMTINNIISGRNCIHVTGKEKIQRKKKQKTEFDFDAKASDKLESIKANCDLKNGHWIWKGGSRPDGYGSTSFNGYSTLVHRIAWQCTNKQTVPDGLVVRHKCLEKKCCAPGIVY